MAPPKSKNPPNHPDGEQCLVCGLVLARRGDMPRHMRTHLEDKDHMLHRCPWEGCTYANLQRSNVDTHYRTHTKEQTQICPDCDFKSVDPGSLTRHRKRKHGYVPKARRSRQAGPQPITSTPSSSSKAAGSIAASRASRRHQPYGASRSRSRSVSASSNDSSSSTSDPTTTSPSADPTLAAGASSTAQVFRVIVPSHYPSLSRTLHDVKPPRKVQEEAVESDSSYFWRRLDGERMSRTPSPKSMSPGVDSSPQMQDTTKTFTSHPFDQPMHFHEEFFGPNMTPKLRTIPLPSFEEDLIIKMEMDDVDLLTSTSIDEMNPLALQIQRGNEPHLPPLRVSLELAFNLFDDWFSSLDSGEEVFLSSAPSPRSSSSSSGMTIDPIPDTNTYTPTSTPIYVGHDTFTPETTSSLAPHANSHPPPGWKS